MSMTSLYCAGSDAVGFCQSSRILFNASVEHSQSCKTSVNLAGEDSVYYGSPAGHDSYRTSICLILR